MSEKRPLATDPTASTRAKLLSRALRVEADLRKSAQRIAILRAAIQALSNRVADVLGTMDDDAEIVCPWCGRNPHWHECDILPILQYAMREHGGPL